MNIVAIGAHPDDIEYGCYGTLKKHQAKGDKIFIIILSHGEKAGSKDSRRSEAQKAAKTLDAKLFMFDFPDTNIPLNHEVIDKIERVIADVKPQRVYTHSIKDTHQDHRNIAYSTLAAARFVPEILCYESPSLYIGFSPNYYVDITKFIDEKEKVLGLFTTQNHKEYMKINAIQGLAQFRGLANAVKYAEAFDVIKILKIDGV